MPPGAVRSSRLTMTLSAVGQAGPVQTSAPTRKNNNRSCQRCREKRVKCDGKMGNEAGVGAVNCSNCEAAGVQECTWDKKPDRRLSVKKAEYEQRGAVIDHQKLQLAALQERLRQHGISDDIPDDMNNEDDSYGGAHTNQSDADDDLVAGFNGLVLEGDDVVFYGVSSPFADHPAPVRPKPRLPAIDGFNHSTSRMYEIRPMHALGQGPGRDSEKWDIHLPRDTDGSRLITRDQHDEVLEIFFRFFTSWTLRIIPHFFLRDLAIETEAPDPKPQINHYSPMLHNFVVAVALAFATDPKHRQRTLRDKFIAKGKLDLDSEVRRPTLSTVQSLALLSSYFSGLGDQTLGYMYFGDAIRIGQALGLHVRIPDGKIGNDDRLERNWVYWSVFIHDKTWSLYVGRNQGLPTTQVQMRDPPIDFRMDTEQWYWTAPDGRVINQQAWLSSTFAEVVKLCRLASQIMAAVYDEHLASRLQWKIGQINGIWHDLRTWHENLKKELRIDTPATAMQPSHIFMLNLAYEWMLLLLLRPFYEPHVQKLAASGVGRVEELRKLCRLANEECPKSANRVLELLRSYDKLFTLRLCPVTNVQIAYLAGKTHLRTVIAGGVGEKKAAAAGLRARDKVLECARHLRAIGETWTSGSVTAEMLEKDLEREIERQNGIAEALARRTPPADASQESQSTQTLLAPPSGSVPSRTVRPTAPRAIPSTSHHSVRPHEFLATTDGPANIASYIGGSSESPTNKRQRSSPPIPDPAPKRRMQQRASPPYQSLGATSFTSFAAMSADNPEQFTSSSAEPEGNLSDPSFDLLISPDSFGLSVLSPSTASSSGSPRYYPPPAYPPPSSSRQHQHQQFVAPVPTRRAPFDPITGIPLPTSMNQWFESGNSFSGAPSDMTPVLPFEPPMFPLDGEPWTDLEEL